MPMDFLTSQQCTLPFQWWIDIEKDSSRVTFHFTDLLANAVNVKIWT